MLVAQQSLILAFNQRQNGENANLFDDTAMTLVQMRRVRSARPVLLLQPMSVVGADSHAGLTLIKARDGDQGFLGIDRDRTHTTIA